MEPPSKSAYSLEEVSKKWNCNIDDLLQYWLDNKLRIALLLPDVHIEERLVCDKVRVDEYNTNGLHYVESDSDYYITNIVTALSRNNCFTLDFNYQLFPCKDIDGHGDDVFEKWDSCRNGILHIHHQEMTGPLEGIHITINDLRITALEIERFEEKRINHTGNKSEDDKLISTRLENNLLKTIAVLTNLLADSKGLKLKKGSGDININQVAEEILNHLKLHGIDTNGMEKRTLSDRIKNSLDSLDEG